MDADTQSDDRHEMQAAACYVASRMGSTAGYLKKRAGGNTKTENVGIKRPRSRLLCSETNDFEMHELEQVNGRDVTENANTRTNTKTNTNTHTRAHLTESGTTHTERDVSLIRGTLHCIVKEMSNDDLKIIPFRRIRLKLLRTLRHRSQEFGIGLNIHARQGYWEVLTSHPEIISLIDKVLVHYCARREGNGHEEERTEEQEQLEYVGTETETHSCLYSICCKSNGTKIPQKIIKRSGCQQSFLCKQSTGSSNIH